MPSTGNVNEAVDEFDKQTGRVVGGVSRMIESARRFGRVWFVFVVGVYLDPTNDAGVGSSSHGTAVPATRRQSLPTSELRRQLNLAEINLGLSQTFQAWRSLVARSKQPT